MQSRETILEKFVDARHQEGATIPKRYFWELFDIKEPRGLMEVKAKEDADFSFMSCMVRLQKDLLEKNGIDMQNIRNAWMIVPWQDRVSRASRDGQRKWARERLKVEARLSHIPHPEQLNSNQQKERDHMLMALEMSGQLMRKARRYPTS